MNVMFRCSLVYHQQSQIYLCFINDQCWTGSYTRESLCNDNKFKHGARRTAFKGLVTGNWEKVRKNKAGEGGPKVSQSHYSLLFMLQEGGKEEIRFDTCCSVLSPNYIYSFLKECVEGFRKISLRSYLLKSWPFKSHLTLEIPP